MLLAACSAPPPPRPIIANTPARAPRDAAVFPIDAQRFGPLARGMPATVEAVRSRLPGYTVTEDVQEQLVVSVDGERLFYVVVDEETGEVFNIHVLSPRIQPPHRAWRATTKFTRAAELTHCECWGEHPVCFAEGDFIAVGFERECSGLDEPEERAALEGLEIQRLVWSPRPFQRDVPATD